MVYKNEKAKITAVACYWEDFQNNQLNHVRVFTVPQL